MKIGDRIRREREAQDMSRAELCRISGVKYPTLAGIENGDQESSTQLHAIAAALGVAPKWLETGRGTKNPSATEQSEWADVKGYASDVALGDGASVEEWAETHKLKFRTSSLRNKGLLGARLEVYYGRGDSMEPNVRDGDALLVDRSDTAPRDGLIFLLESSDGAVAKRLEEIDGRWYVTSDNKADPKWRKPVAMDGRKHFTILGRVRWIGRWEG